ncbi:MAG: SDR family oxidoreductase [Patescibacteria group bacterium]
METLPATIITGGGRGIGRAIAFRMCRGTPIVIIGRSKKHLLKVCEEIGRFKGSEGDVCCIVGDVSDPKFADVVVNECRLWGWHPQNLVCNAGIGTSWPTESFDTDLWKGIMDVNVNGAFHFVKACLPSMIDQNRGTIVLMSSIAGLKGYSHNLAYVASKHALVGMAKGLAVEYGKHGIVSVAICPGFVESDMTERSIASAAKRKNISNEAARELIARVNPQRRIIPAEEVAEMVAQVCSGKLASLSGSAIVMSGGE